MKFLSPFDFRLLLVWIFSLAILIPVFYGLSSHPRFLLRMEESQPALAYAKGLELQKQGRKTEAIAEFEKGRKFFQNLYKETRIPDHQKQAVLCMLAAANLLSDPSNPTDLIRALDIYRQAILLEPELSEGTPYLSQGHVLRWLGRHAEAVDSYTEAIQRGNALLILDTLYGRGLSYIELGKNQEAADDWYYFLRYYAGNITQEQWSTFRRLPDSDNPRRYLIWADAAIALNHPDAARKHLESYSAGSPPDRFAQYLAAIIQKQPIPSDGGNIPLSECFPAGAATPIRINKTVLDLYSAQNQSRSLTLKLAGETAGTVIPEVVLYLNRIEIKPSRLISSQPQDYTIPLEMKIGRNLLRMEAKKSTIPGNETKIWLYSIQLK